MTSKEIKKMFEIPHKFKQAEFQEKKKNTPNKMEKIQKEKNSDKQSFNESKCAKGRDNKEN